MLHKVVVDEREAMKASLAFPKYRNVHYCELKKLIAEFYLTELEFFNRKNVWQGCLPGRIEEYYWGRFLDMSELLLMFLLSVVLGESRWFGYSDITLWSMKERWNGGGSWRISDAVERTGMSKRNLYSLFSQARKEHQVLYKKLGMKCYMADDGSPKKREFIYNFRVPIRLWREVFDSLEVIFNEVFWCDSHFGGGSWRKAVQLGRQLYDSWVGCSSISDIIIYFDRIIHHLHNGGLLFSKFNCGDSMVSIMTVLDRARDGRVSLLRETVASECGYFINSGLGCSLVIWRENE